MRIFAGGETTRPQSLARPGLIRVLVVAARFHPDLGGTETATREIATRMARRDDFDLTVLTTDRSASRPSREEIDGFTVLRCRAYPRHRDYYFAPGIYKHILNSDYDVIHCQGIHTAVPILAMAAARRRRIPYIVTLHTGGHSSGIRRRLRNSQWRSLGPLLRGAAMIVAVSSFEQRIFQKACSLDASRCRIIPNGGELPGNLAPAEPVPGRIVSCGRLERYKGHQRIIKALPIVQRSVPEATLHILGAGPYERQLRACTDALGLEKTVAIECIKPDDRERMSETLGQASVVAVLSDYESHPLAVIEALTLGIPVAGLDTAGIGDLVRDKLVRGVPKDASPAAVAQILVAALQDGRANVSGALPTWDAATIDLAHVYRDVVGATLRAPCP